MGNSTSSSTVDNGATKDFIQQEIGSHDVVIFSKSYCPYCDKTKRTVKSNFGTTATTKVYELDQMPNGNAIQGTLQSLTGQRTVPNVFVKGQHVGGNDDTQAAVRSGRMAEMLAKS